MGTFVIGTVKQDLHDIGKNLVAMMLSGAGMEVVDLRMDIPPRTSADAIEKHQTQIVRMSAPLNTTLGEMKTTIQALEQVGLRDTPQMQFPLLIWPHIGSCGDASTSLSGSSGPL